LSFTLPDDYSGACLPNYEPQFVDVLNESGDAGYIVIDKCILGRCWGGLRFATDLTLDEVRILARTMTMKSVLAGIPIGGAKCGIRPRTKIIEKDQMLGMASRLVGRYIRKQSYFLGTDIGFSERDANRLYQLAGSRRHHFSGALSPGVCCGHSVLSSIEYVKQMKPNLEAVTVALEGFGNMAIPTAKLLSSKGYRIIAVSNIEGTLEDAAKLNIDQLTEMAVALQNGFLSRYAHEHPSATFRSGESILTKECDILIPGARICSINETVAKIIKSKLVCPIANSTITASGERVLASRGIVSIPDIISNSGAIIGNFAQILGANESLTKRIIADIVNSNMKKAFSGSAAGQIPKLLALDSAIQRMKSLEESESVTAFRWLTPWFREFGFQSILRALREYVSLKVFELFSA
jgi:glutamate dehydrogenase (NAD(P)+)